MIETERLIIVPFEMKFAEDYYREFDEEITRYQYPDSFKTLADAEEMLASFIETMEQGEMLFGEILAKEGDFAGGVEVHGLNEEYPEVGIWIRKGFQRRGFAYEALAAVAEFVASQYRKDWLVYEADIRNISSIRLVEKFPYTQEGMDEFETGTGKHLSLQRFLIQIGKGKEGRK